MSIEKIFCEVMELKELPKNFERIKMGNIVQWDSIGNMNLLMALEEHFSIRLTIEEMSKINSIAKIRSKFPTIKKIK